VFPGTLRIFVSFTGVLTFDLLQTDPDGLFTSVFDVYVLG
jgi:hypothetical protein